jgi:hypothetical protein
MHVAATLSPSGSHWGGRGNCGGFFVCLLANTLHVGFSTFLLQSFSWCCWGVYDTPLRWGGLGPSILACSSSALVFGPAISQRGGSRLQTPLAKRKFLTDFFFSLFQATSQTLPDFYARSNFTNSAKIMLLANFFLSFLVFSWHCTEWYCMTASLFDTAQVWCLAANI